MFDKRHPEAGARPGTLVIPDAAEKPIIRVIAYSADDVTEVEAESIDDLEHYESHPGTVWVDVQGLGDEDLLRRLAERFDVHPLALEDAVNAPQRPKTELYEEHQLVIARAPVREGVELLLPQVAVFVGQGYVMTIQERAYGFFDPVRKRIRAGIGPIRTAGASYLAYALIDTLTDLYYPISECLAQEVDGLEEQILKSRHEDLLVSIHEIRRMLVLLRRVALPQKEATHTLANVDSPFISDATRTHLHDTLDHMAQIVDVLESSREMTLSLAELHLSLLGHRQNEIMKVLTLMASIFIPMTFVAGVYGMNFQHMPELAMHDAYFIVLGVMALIALGMVGYFKHRGWIGGPKLLETTTQRLSRILDSVKSLAIKDDRRP